MHFHRLLLSLWYIFLPMAQPTPSQLFFLQALAEGGVIAVVHTRGGTIASLFPRQGRHRNISYKAVQPMCDAGWLQDVVPGALRWRGSKYVLSQQGRQVLKERGVHPLTPVRESTSGVGLT
jgi:hypothetical protein